MELTTLIDRTQVIRGANGIGQAVKQRLADTAQELSRAGENQARVELLNEAVLSLATILYECDADGQPANIDVRTWRLLVPAPWTSAGWRRWGLRNWESRVLRHILQGRADLRRPVAVFDYSAESRTWFLNLDSYPELDDTLQYWREYPVRMAEFRQHADRYRQAAHERMRAIRAQRR